MIRYCLLLGLACTSCSPFFKNGFKPLVVMGLRAMHNKSDLYSIEHIKFLYRKNPKTLEHLDEFYNKSSLDGKIRIKDELIRYLDSNMRNDQIPKEKKLKRRLYDLELYLEEINNNI